MNEKEIEKIKLLGRYEFALKRMTITLMFAIPMFFIAGIVLIIRYLNIFWIGLCAIIFSVFLLVYYFILRNYILKKINVLKDELKTDQSSLS